MIMASELCTLLSSRITPPRHGIRPAGRPTDRGEFMRPSRNRGVLGTCDFDRSIERTMTSTFLLFCGQSRFEKTASPI